MSSVASWVCSPCCSRFRWPRPPFFHSRAIAVLTMLFFRDVRRRGLRHRVASRNDPAPFGRARGLSRRTRRGVMVRRGGRRDADLRSPVRSRRVRNGLRPRRLRSCHGLALWLAAANPSDPSAPKTRSDCGRWRKLITNANRAAPTIDQTTGKRFAADVQDIERRKVRLRGDPLVAEPRSHEAQHDRTEAARVGIPRRCSTRCCRRWRR